MDYYSSDMMGQDIPSMDFSGAGMGNMSNSPMSDMMDPNDPGFMVNAVSPEMFESKKMPEMAKKAMPGQIMPGQIAGQNMPGMDPMPYAGYPMQGAGFMQDDPALYPAAMDPGMAQQEADPPAAMSPEMQEFMEQGYLMGPDCFGRQSQRYANTLMEYIMDEYRDSLYYQILSRRAPTATARRLFREMSADEMRHSRRWAAAYFLITGTRYFPNRSNVQQVAVPSNFSQALRDRYLAESRDAVKYRQFASTVSDRCLRRMATETSNDEMHHAQQILELIQNM